MEGNKKSRRSPKPKQDVEIKMAPSSSRDIENSDPGYRIERRLTPRLPKRKMAFFFNQKNPFLGNSTGFLASETEIHVHGLGASVNTAVNLALQLKSFYADTITLEATTSTVDLIDDHHSPQNGHRVENRKNSAIHIKIAQMATSIKYKYKSWFLLMHQIIVSV
ncbi:ribonuclease P protein subunit p20 [Trichonephila inaurata madagascariensis]|uniref:Ribonuclease P protein subunit p20 n=1 Tax=Trichonephila inaurata madagascariensis TaxID=2747483 RepID=A0A8X6M8P5_9ARAC|nr:ribonuclease P protein subunit p20 [Trichonephila inaurata madagascariensis]